MADAVKGIDVQEQLNRLSRQENRGVKGERSWVAATGAAPSAWTIKIISLVSYNVYSVRQVSIGGVGTVPSEADNSDTEAVNLAESFTSEGAIAVGTYAVMWRAGNKNVFYVEP